MPLVLSGTEKKKFLLESLPLFMITINNVYLNGYAHPDPIPAERGELTALAMGVKKYTLEECFRDLAVWDVVYAGLLPEADAERELDSIDAYLHLHKRAAKLLAEAGQYEEALVHLERTVRGILRPAEEKRCHAFNKLMGLSAEGFGSEYTAAFADAPEGIKQQFYKIMDSITE